MTNESQVMDSCGTAEALVRRDPGRRRPRPRAGSPPAASPRVGTCCPDHYCLLAGLPLGIDLTPLLDRLDASHRGGRASLDDAALIALDGPRADAETTAAAREWLAALQAHRRARVGVAARARGPRRPGRGGAGERRLGRQPGPAAAEARRVPEHGPPQGDRGRRARRRAAGRAGRRRVLLGRCVPTGAANRLRPAQASPAPLRCQTNRTRACCHEHREPARL